MNFYHHFWDIDFICDDMHKAFTTCHDVISFCCHVFFFEEAINSCKVCIQYNNIKIQTFIRPTTSISNFVNFFNVFFWCLEVNLVPNFVFLCLIWLCFMLLHKFSQTCWGYVDFKSMWKGFDS